MQEISLDIDVTGACNLRCPCCPQGNFKDFRPPHGFIEPELLGRIVHKATSECRVTGINLFNWAEPLLHPKLPELIRIIQNAHIPCHVSSNLNLLPDADAIMAAGPASFKISASGFTQAVYALFHQGGDIERVKRHMEELAEAKKRNNAKTRIFISFHRYRGNLKEEPLMRDLAAGLGFDFEPAWALMFPLEKILASVDGEAREFVLTDEDRLLIDHLALPLKEALAYGKKYPDQPCSLRDSQISLDFRGKVMLCCGVFDARKYSIGDYIDMPLDAIQQIRQNHSMCSLCMRHGGHVYLSYRLPEMNGLIWKTIARDDAELLNLRNEFVQKRIQQYVQKTYQKLFSGMITKEQKTALKTLMYRIRRYITR